MNLDEYEALARDAEVLGEWNDGVGAMMLEVAETIRALNARVRELEAKVAEHDASFDLRWKADQRAIKRWQKATGRALVWPDHADLCVWLMQQIAAGPVMPKDAGRVADRLEGYAGNWWSVRGMYTAIRTALMKEHSGRDSGSPKVPANEPSRDEVAKAVGGK